MKILIVLVAAMCAVGSLMVSLDLVFRPWWLAPSAGPMGASYALVQVTIIALLLSAAMCLLCLLAVLHITPPKQKELEPQEV